jgi:hypothetical protein
MSATNPDITEPILDEFDIVDDPIIPTPETPIVVETPVIETPVVEAEKPTTPEVNEAEEYDIEGNPINEPEDKGEPLVVTPTTTKYKVSAIKSELGVEEDEVDEEVINTSVKKLKEDLDYFKSALTAKDEFEKSDDYKNIVGYLELPTDQKYLIDRQYKYIAEHYSEADAKEMAQADLANIEAEKLEREGNRLNNMAKAQLEARKNEFLKNEIEARKRITPEKVVTQIKEVEDILATSDTILGINLKGATPESKAKFLKKPMEAIKSGDATKLLSDPKLQAEFLAFHYNKEEYDKRQRTIGANELRKKTPTATTVKAVTTNTAKNPNGQVPKGGEVYSVDNW